MPSKLLIKYAKPVEKERYSEQSQRWKLRYFSEKNVKKNSMYDFLMVKFKE